MNRVLAPAPRVASSDSGVARRVGALAAALALLSACDGGRSTDTPSASAPPRAEVDPAASSGPKGQVPEDRSQEPASEVTPEVAEAATPDPEAPEAKAEDAAPALAAAPDGTPAIPCESPPEDMACIPAGPFLRGSDDGPENARPAATVWLQTYYMDRNEVTYAEYKACVRARKCPMSGPAYSDFDRPRQPINGISWHDAVAYCRAHGKRLPTEAQWEKAARGDSGELHPWGDEPATCERAILRDASGRGCGVKKQGSKPETGRPWEIGSRPAYRYGLYDMAGNSWEWVADWYTRSYAECGDACLGVDPKGPCGGADECPGQKRKIVRGGSWYWPAEYATAIYRRPHFPENRPFHHFGFRCAATVDDAAALRGAAGSTATP
ncbi:MAG: SUMF1/EgtB/PvdO family nonheme iron enzyme [Nannocystaceae bacterium]